MSIIQQLHAQSLSNRQYSFLNQVLDAGGLSVTKMLNVSQGTAGSVVRRGFLVWEGVLNKFVLSPEGLAVMDAFRTTDVRRESAYRPLSIHIRTNELERLTKDLRERLKQEYDSRKSKEVARESGRDRATEASVRMKRASSKTA